MSNHHLRPMESTQCSNTTVRMLRRQNRRRCAAYRPCSIPGFSHRLSAIIGMGIASEKHPLLNTCIFGRRLQDHCTPSDRISFATPNLLTAALFLLPESSHGSLEWVQPSTGVFVRFQEDIDRAERTEILSSPTAALLGTGELSTSVRR